MAALFFWAAVFEMCGACVIVAVVMGFGLGPRSAAFALPILAEFVLGREIGLSYESILAFFVCQGAET